MDIVIGTAGHIDHGKTALVKALTGTDADRLPEEKKRGITIDIGFAELDLGDVRASFVDVPGHERFVKNMLAGASGIDLVMLVIAADEGVMPQTREHFNICRLLGVRLGIIVLTKSDLADDEMLEIVRLDMAELVAGSFLEHAPVIVASSRTAAGIDELKQKIRDVSLSLPRRDVQQVTMLPIDRSFSVKGYGSVVTGTLHSGEIGIDSTLEILPMARSVRVRGVQSHGRASETAEAGRRVAVNLGGIDHTEIERGMLLAERGVLRPTQVFDVFVEMVKDAARPLRSRQRVRVHLGTAELLARIIVLDETGEIEPGGSGLIQIRLERPSIAVFRHRVILRSYSPQDTIAGGVVLDPFAPRHRKKTLVETRARLSKLNDPNTSRANTLEAFITASGELGVSKNTLGAITGLQETVLTEELKTVVSVGMGVEANGLFIAPDTFEAIKSRVVAAIDDHHKREPLSRGISKEALRESGARIDRPEIFDSVIEVLKKEGKIIVAGDTISRAERTHEFSPSELNARKSIVDVLERSGVEVPKLSELLEAIARSASINAAHVRKILQTLIDSNEVVKVSEDFFFSRRVIEGLIGKLRDLANSGDRTIDVSKFKDLAGVSRKYAIPLLEYFDSKKITIRTGDKRVIR